MTAPVRERVAIASAVLVAVRAAARASPDREVCGLLLGAPGRVDEAMPAANVAADPTAWFEVDPRTLFRALRAERAGGAHLLGHYHSHPRGTPDPSPRDAAAAEPGRLWLIVDPAGEARMWRAMPHGFQPVLMEVVPSSGDQRPGAAFRSHCQEV